MLFSYGIRWKLPDQCIGLGDEVDVEGGDRPHRMCPHEEHGCVVAFPVDTGAATCGGIHVRHKGQDPDSRDQAELAVHATLQALADRITAGQAQDLALYLPAEVRADLTGVAEPARPFNRSEFLERIAAIESTDHATAEQHAHAVLTALRVNIPEDEFADTLDQLPSDIGRLAR